MRVEIDLVKDWIAFLSRTLAEAGHPIAGDLLVEQVPIRFYGLQHPQPEAERLADEAMKRLQLLQQTILDNLNSVIVPDLRARTGYDGDELLFRWVYQDGEHIVEEKSQYRIPLQ
ncbi:hypothetical protein [Paenibacillus turpanensis]|uniref:hypothetical protein n=1 Tax=Paenibacillus turpanensis TaxID=2689078 RepID=UPI00140D4EB3|nr:hypothetical protein [Paenibacillus turpanensis]